MYINVKSLDSLICGIKHLLKRRRCSFTDKEKVLLSSCIFTLQEFKIRDSEKPKILNQNLIIRIIEILIRVFLEFIKLKNFF